MWPSMRAPLESLLFALGISLFFIYSIGDSEKCASPQYTELGHKGTILCSLEGFYAISWYNSTILRNENPIIHFNNFNKRGSGYTSGEFDIDENGSLIITNVSFKHDHSFAVEYLQSRSSDPLVINIDVVVIVTPRSSFPVVDACKNVTGICFMTSNRSNLSCSVEFARPKVLLQWTAKSVIGNKNISFFEKSETDGQLYTSRISTTDAFTYTPRLVLAACTAHTLPEMLERHEYLVLLQNKNQSILTAEPTMKYVELYSAIELSCTENSTGYLVWWNIDESSQHHLLLYAVLIGNQQNEILETGYEVGREGSLIVPKVNIENQGLYSCIYSNGVSDGIMTYKIIVYANPIPNYPVIEGCNNSKYCGLDVKIRGNLTCSVFGIRPKVHLHWMLLKTDDPIYFESQSLLVLEKGDTFDISVSSSYNSYLKEDDTVSVVCKVHSPDEVFDGMATTVDLIFSKEPKQHPTTDGIFATNSPQENDMTIKTIIATIILTVLSIFALTYGVRRQKEQLRCQWEKELQYLEQYLQEIYTYLLNEFYQTQSSPEKKLHEFLRKICLMGVEIRGDANLQGAAIALLDIATKRKIYIKSVIIRECFSSVLRGTSVVMKNSEHRLTSKTDLTQLNIDFGNETFEEQRLPELKKIFTFASRCRKLRTLKFSNCILPFHFDDVKVLYLLQNKNVEVHWENGILFPKYILNLSNGQWQNDADASQLLETDYDHMKGVLSEEPHTPGYSQILKGTKNYSPLQMVHRENILKTMERIFKLHGAEAIHTSLFELKQTFVQYFDPEYSRLMYCLNDQGMKSLALRFDLTIPFVRYIEINNITAMKRYHIGKVYRRESSVMKGRRCGEFYQCDFDIAGHYARMVPDAESIKIAYSVLNELKVGEFIVKVNHQKVINGLLEVLDVPLKDFLKISGVIDDISQMSPADIKAYCSKRRLSYGKDVDKLLKYIQIKGGKAQIETLLKDEELVSKEEAKEGLEDLQILFLFCENLGVKQMQFDMSLTRSMGYYTGLIFEAVLSVPPLLAMKNFKKKGILANGGRFDELVEKFTQNRTNLPCVGFTFDFEQIFALIEFREKNRKIATKPTEVLVTSPAENPHTALEILIICNKLWDAEVKTEITNVCAENITDADSTNTTFVINLPKDDSDHAELITTSLGDKELIRKDEVVAVIKQRLHIKKKQQLAVKNTGNEEENNTYL